MGWLRVILGLDGPRSRNSTARSEQWTKPERSRMEPFNYVSSGLEAWQAGNHRRAEPLLRQAVDAYRRVEPDGVDFALGRLGAYLLDQERVDAAGEVLDEAIDRGTDIPAIWRDSLDVRARRRDIDALFDVARRWHASSHGPERPWDGLLGHARQAERAGDSEFAIAVADRVAANAVNAGDQQAAWLAIGVLGHIRERAGQLDKALDLWSEAFAEGSDDPTTANRLSMHRERARDYAGAIAVIEAALERQLPANVEEQVRKRLERCRARVEGRGRRDVPAYSVRIGKDALVPAFQARVSPASRFAQVHGSVARCFGVSKGVGTFVDVSLVDGSQVGRHTGLPAFGGLTLSPNGYGLGAVQTGRIGSGETTLTFFTPEPSVVSTSRVPDAVSKIADAGDLWYVGCRDGYLYCYRHTGELLWRWATPGSGEHDGDAYSRPCPYYVASDGDRAVVASMDNVYCISPTGATVWHFRLPEDATLPDDAGDEGSTALEFSITVMGIAPTVASLVASADATLIGSSDGRLLALSPTGQLRGVYVLGEGWVHPVVDADGTLIAAYDREALFLRESTGFRHIADLADVPDAVGVWSGGLFVRSRKRLDLVEWTGRVHWSVEFSKNLSSAVVHEGRLICAAGVLAVFARTGESVL